MYPPIHQKPNTSFTYDRLNMLWDRYPQYHEMSVFSSLEQLLEEHESWKEDFAELREEYEREEYDRFLVQLSWSDLPYRYATKELMENHGPFSVNPHVETFLNQFSGLDRIDIPGLRILHFIGGQIAGDVVGDIVEHQPTFTTGSR